MGRRSHQPPLPDLPPPTPAEIKAAQKRDAARIEAENKNPQLYRLAQDFIWSKAERTRRNWENRLQPFVGSWDSRARLDDLTPEYVRKFMDRQKGLSAETVRARLVRIRAFLRWLNVPDEIMAETYVGRRKRGRPTKESVMKAKYPRPKPTIIKPPQ